MAGEGVWRVYFLRTWAMLRLLSITDFAIIDHLDLELAPGFNVLTGETGAGKSVIIEAVSILLGGRADSASVRSGAQQTRVQGLFQMPEAGRARLLAALSDHGIDPDGDELILAREINLEGRNVCRVNGHIVPLKTLAALGEHLVDIHGQGQHLSLLRVREHVGILDRYAGLDGLRGQVEALVRRLREARNELERLCGDERDLTRRADLLAFQVREITEAALRPGEEEDLVREQALAANAEHLLALTEEAYHTLSGSTGQSRSVSDLLAEAVSSLSRLERLDPALRDVRESIEALLFQSEDAARALQIYHQGVEHNPLRLVEIEERLGLVLQLKRKYGDSIEEVLSFGGKAALELEGLSRRESRIGELEQETEELLRQIGDVAGRLSEERKKAATGLASAIEAGLEDLALEGSRVEVGLSRKKSPEGVPVRADGPERFAFDLTGIDQVEFMFSANPGEPLRPLARIASGGESSRLMLAIKNILSTADRVPVLVFDEIDAGIGGRVGTSVGRKLWGLSNAHQVLCVTHLPQIAAYGDRHLRVAKSDDGRVTRVTTEEVSGDARVRELSEMLGAVGEASLLNAHEILGQTAEWKQAGA